MQAIGECPGAVTEQLVVGLQTQAPASGSPGESGLVSRGTSCPPKHLPGLSSAPSTQGFLGPSSVHVSGLSTQELPGAGE